nr:hypothetical protein [Pseudomonas sp. CVAP\
MHYNRYQYYDPSVGRLISQDPMRVCRWPQRLSICTESDRMDRPIRLRKNEPARKQGGYILFDQYSRGRILGSLDLFFG